MLSSKILAGKFKRRFKNALIISIVTGLLVTGLTIWILGEKMLTPKRRITSTWHHKILDSPSEHGLTIAPFSVSAEDGASLKAFLITPTKTVYSNSIKRSRMEGRLRRAGYSTKNDGMVLIVHGRGGIKEDALPIAERFVAAGLSVTVFDNRAHGQSGGRYCTYGHLEVGDSLAVLEAGLEQADLPDNTPTFGFGYSLGAAIMIQTLASTERFTAATVIAPYYDLEELVVYSGGKFSAGKLPHWMAGSVVRLGELRAGFDCSKVAPITSASRINTPTFVIHGELDTVIPAHHGHRIFDAIPHSGKRWLQCEGTYHGNILSKGGDDLYQDILEYFLSTAAEKQGLTPGS